MLLSILKKVLDKRPELRVILMSATADTTMFQKYLSNYGHQNALPPVINVQGKCFPVKEHYLEDLSRMLKNSNLLSRQIQPFFSQNFQPRSLEEQNMYLKVIKTTIDYICTTKESGAILIFLSGWNEISIVKDLLMKDELSVGYKNNNRFKICALHSSVPMNDQKVAFTVHGSDVRKIILATNIAETSITVSQYH